MHRCPLLAQYHQLTTATTSKCPILTQYTASSSRNAQLSLLDLVFILFRHHKHIWSFNHCSNNAIWARVVQLYVSCNVNWSSAGHPSSVTKELHIEVLQSMVASDCTVVKSIVMHSCEFLLQHPSLARMGWKELAHEAKSAHCGGRFMINLQTD